MTDTCKHPFTSLRIDFVLPFSNHILSSMRFDLEFRVMFSSIYSLYARESLMECCAANPDALRRGVTHGRVKLRARHGNKSAG